MMKWPVSNDPIAWLRCTGELAAATSGEDLSYGFFAVGHLFKREAVDHAAKILRGLEARCDADHSEELALNYLIAGDQASAVRVLQRLLVTASRMKRKSERDYHEKQVKTFLATHGATAPLGDASLKLARPPMPAKIKQTWRDKPLAEKLTLAHASLAELGPDERNVHYPAQKVAAAIAALCDVGRDDEARELLDDALVLWSLEEFDLRDFASGGAYVALARAALRVHGAEAAQPLLDTALAVAGSSRATVASDIAEVYGEMGATDEALALAKKVRGASGRLLRAQLLCRAGRWAALGESLAELTDPGEAVKVAWAVTREVDPETNYWI